jgi:hypothetical protein
VLPGQRRLRVPKLPIDAPGGSNFTLHEVMAAATAATTVKSGVRLRIVRFLRGVGRDPAILGTGGSPSTGL